MTYMYVDFEQLASIKYVSLGIIRDFKIVVSAGP